MKKNLSLPLMLCFVIGSLYAHSSFADDKKAQDFAVKAQQKVRMGDLSAANLLYMQALQESPHNTEISVSVAEIYIQQHRYAEAEKIIAASDQNNYRVWRARSILLQVQGYETQSISALEKAFTLGGREDTFILSRLQMYYENTGNTAHQKQMENLLDAVALKTKK